MHTGKILASAIAGTSAMTLFSYLISESQDENFREPVVLGQLIKNSPINCSKEHAKMAGWGTHYAAGILFEVVYNEVWKRNEKAPSIASGALLGGASGLAGIIAWKVAFEAHPNPPVKNLKKYFGHLLLAHVVFGAVSALAYKTLVADNTN